MSIFNKINYVFTVDVVKNVFQRRSSEVLPSDVLKVQTIQKDMIHCQSSVVERTQWLVFSVDHTLVR